MTVTFMYSQENKECEVGEGKYNNLFKYKYDKGNFFVGGFVTNEKYWGADAGLKNTQGFEAQFEYYFIDQMSIGGFASYSRSNFDFDNKGEYESKYKDFTLGAIINKQLFHFEPLGLYSDLFTFFVYAGARVGYKKASLDIKLPKDTDYSGLVGGLHLGVRVVLSKKLDAQVEFGSYYTSIHPELGKLFGYGRAGISYNF